MATEANNAKKRRGHPRIDSSEEDEEAAVGIAQGGHTKRQTERLNLDVS